MTIRVAAAASAGPTALRRRPAWELPASPVHAPTQHPPASHPGTPAALDAAAAGLGRFPLHCEAMLRSLLDDVGAEQVVLMFQPTSRSMDNRPAGILVQGEQRARTVPIREIPLVRGSEANCWIEHRKCGVLHSSHIRALLWQSARQTVLVELVRTRIETGFNTQDLLKLRLLAPGLGLSLRSALHCAASTLAADQLDRSPLALALLDADRRILFRNPAMACLLGQADSLYAELGLLGARQPEAQEQLAMALRQIGSGDQAHSCLIPLPREGGENPPYLAVAERFEPFFAGDRSCAPNRIRLAVIDPGCADDKAAARLGKHYALTRTETSIAQAMLRGLDVARCSETMGMSINTVRWHQKRIFAKTHTEGRAGLILLFLRGMQLMGA